jgi:NAD(P)-dependent dehydrogenase (short-subunit alcohol dehydrogenase family)
MVYGIYHQISQKNTAGTGLHANFSATTEGQFDELVNIHLKGPFFLTQKALNLKNEGSGIVNISTSLTRFANPGSSAYASMKGAIETLTKYQAKVLSTTTLGFYFTN